MGGELMKIVSFSEGQSGKEWLEWRKNGVGASDIGVLTGSNPYKTVLELWNEKCGFTAETPITPPMAHGIKNEPIARDWINSHQNLNLQPLCLEDMEHSFFRASLDGYDAEKSLLTEIKCPLRKDILDKAREHRNLPLSWEHQIQWQIMLCKPKRAFITLWDYRDESCITIEAFAKPTLQEEMRNLAKDFWIKVQMGIAPAPSENDYITVNNPQLQGLLDDYRDHDGVAKAAEARKKELRAQIVEFGDDGNFTCNGYFITRCSPRVTYDMEKMKREGIDVERYVKKNKGIGYYKIFLPKG